MLKKKRNSFISIFMALAIIFTTCFGGLYFNEKKAYATYSLSNPYAVFNETEDGTNAFVEQKGENGKTYVWFASKGIKSSSGTKFKTVGVTCSYGGATLIIPIESVLRANGNTSAGKICVAYDSEDRTSTGALAQTGEEAYTSFRIEYSNLVDLFEKYGIAKNELRKGSHTFVFSEVLTAQINGVMQGYVTNCGELVQANYTGPVYWDYNNWVNYWGNTIHGSTSIFSSGYFNLPATITAEQYIEDTISKTTYSVDSVLKEVNPRQPYYKILDSKNPVDSTVYYYKANEPVNITVEANGKGSTKGINDLTNVIRPSRNYYDFYSNYTCNTNYATKLVGFYIEKNVATGKNNLKIEANTLSNTINMTSSILSGKVKDKVYSKYTSVANISFKEGCYWFLTRSMMYNAPTIYADSGYQNKRCMIFDGTAPVIKNGTTKLSSNISLVGNTRYRFSASDPNVNTDTKISSYDSKAKTGSGLKSFILYDITNNTNDAVANATITNANSSSNITYELKIGKKYKLVATDNVGNQSTTMITAKDPSLSVEPIIISKSTYNSGSGTGLTGENRANYLNDEGIYYVACNKTASKPIYHTLTFNATANATINNMGFTDNENIINKNSSAFNGMSTGINNWYTLGVSGKSIQDTIAKVNNTSIYKTNTIKVDSSSISKGANNFSAALHFDESDEDKKFVFVPYAGTSSIAGSGNSTIIIPDVTGPTLVNKEDLYYVNKEYSFIFKDFSATQLKNANLDMNNTKPEGSGVYYITSYMNGHEIINKEFEKGSDSVSFTINPEWFNGSETASLNITIYDNVGNSSSYSLKVKVKSIILDNFNFKVNDEDGLYEISDRKYWIRQNLDSTFNMQATISDIDKTTRLTNDYIYMNTEGKTDNLGYINNNKNTSSNVKNSSFSMKYDETDPFIAYTTRTISFLKNGDKIVLTPKVDVYKNGSVYLETNKDSSKALTFYVDGIAPKITKTLVSEDINSITYKFDITENGSGIRKTTILANGSTVYTSKNKSFSYTFRKDDTTSKVYSIISTDNVGNVSDIDTIDIKCRSIFAKDATVTDNTALITDGITAANFKEYPNYKGYWVKTKTNIKFAMSSETSYADKYFRPTSNVLTFKDVVAAKDISLKSTKANPSGTVSTTTSDSSAIKITSYIDKSIDDKKFVTNNILTQFLISGKTYLLSSGAESIYDTTLLATTTNEPNMVIKTDGVAPVINKVPTKTIKKGKIIYTFNAKDALSGMDHFQILSGTTILASSNLSENVSYTFTKAGTYTLKAWDRVNNISTKTIKVSDTPGDDVDIILEHVYVDTLDATINGNMYKINDRSYWIKNNVNVALIYKSHSSYIDDIFKVTNNTILVNELNKKKIDLYELNPNSKGITVTNNTSSDITVSGQKLARTNNYFTTSANFKFIKKTGTYTLVPYCESFYDSYSLAKSSEETGKALVFKVDGVAPTISNPIESFKNGKLTYTFTAKDNESGLKKIEIYKGNTLVASSTTSSITKELNKNTLYSIKATDNVGNIKTLSYTTSIFKIDINKTSISGSNIYKAGSIYWVKPKTNVKMVISSSTNVVLDTFMPTTHKYNIISSKDVNKLPNATILADGTIKNDISTNKATVTNTGTRYMTVNKTNYTKTYSNGNKTLNTTLTSQFISNNGRYVLYPNAKVEYGNIINAESGYDSTKNITIYTDGIAPSEQLKTRKNETNKAICTFNADDGDGSGVKNIQIMNNSSKVLTDNSSSDTKTSINYTFTTSGTYKVVTTDNVGNKTTHSYDIDIEAPKIYVNDTDANENEISIDYTKFKSKIKITDNLSGIKTYTIKDNNTNEVIYTKTISKEKILEETYDIDFEELLKKGHKGFKIEAIDYQDNKSISNLIKIKNTKLKLTYIDTNAGYSDKTIATRNLYLYDIYKNIDKNGNPYITILNNASYKIGEKIYQNESIASEKYSFQGFALKRNQKKGYKPNEKVNFYTIINSARKVNDGYTLFLYTAWDKFPVITAKDKYIPLKEIEDITSDDILKDIIGSDIEDGNITNKIKIKDFDEKIYKEITDSAVISETLELEDSVGNITYKIIYINILNTNAQIPEFYEYARFISPEYYKKSKENGGLEDTSIWKTNSEYAEVLEKAMSNTERNKEIDKFDFLTIHKTKELDGTGKWDNVDEEYFFTTDNIREIRTEMAKLGQEDYEKDDVFLNFYNKYIKQYKISE